MKSLHSEKAELKSKKDGLKQPEEEVLQKALSAFQKKSKEKVDKIFSSLPCGALGISINSNQLSHSRLARKTSELRTRGETSAKNWHTKTEHSKSYERAIQYRQHAYIVAFSSIALPSRREKLNPFISSHTNKFAATLMREILQNSGLPCFLLTLSGSKLSTLSPAPPFSLKLRDWQSQICQALETLPLETLFSKLSATDIFSPVTTLSKPQNLNKKRQELYVAEVKLLSISTDGTCDLGFW